MIAMQVVACLGIMAGCFLLFGISLTDFTGNIFTKLLDGPKGIREEILEQTQRKKKSFFRREIEEVQSILKATDRENTFPLPCTAFVCGRSRWGSHAWQLLFSAGVGGRIYVPALLVYQADRIPFQKGCVCGTGNGPVHYNHSLP